MEERIQWNQRYWDELALEPCVLSWNYWRNDGRIDLRKSKRIFRNIGDWIPWPIRSFLIKSSEIIIYYQIGYLIDRQWILVKRVIIVMW